MRCPRKDIFLSLSFFHFHPTRVSWVDHISTYYILCIARLVGFVTVDLYPIHGLPSKLGPHQVLRGIVLPTEQFLNLVQLTLPSR